MEISKQFGITKEVFRNEIDDEINIAIVPLKSELEEIRKKYLPFEKWDKLTIFMGRCQVSIFNFFKRPFIKLEGWKKLLIWFIILSLFASFVTSVIFNEFNLADTNPVISKVMKCILWIVPVIFTIIFAGPTIKDWTKKTKER
jgi:hypothetical protein